MRQTRNGLLVATTLIMAMLAACTSAPKPADRPIAQTAPTSDVYRYALARALDQAQKGEYDEAYPALSGVIRSPAFAGFESPAQHAALLVAGLVALDLDKAQEAYDFLLKSSGMPEADAEDWSGRLEAARRLDRHEDTVESLTQLARRWPKRVQEANYRVVRQIFNNARHASGGEPALHALLDALYTAKWTLPDKIEPSKMWRELAALELDRKQYARAREVVSRVQAPHVVISMRIDRRFDRLREEVPQYFDVDAAVVNELTTMRAIVQRSPRSLDAVVQLTYSLLNAGLYQDILDITSDVTRRVDAASGKEAPYDDMDNYIWILNNRSRALVRTKRWSEAEAELRDAANRKENGHRNVSNIINLAWFYARAGRPDEALATLVGLGMDMSPYGLMQVHAVRHAAALQRGDLVIASESLRYLDEHRKDALGTWQGTLVRANRLDEAAALLIERLGDPVLRGEALSELQDYADPPQQEQSALWSARWVQIRNRPDVRRAVDAVGRIEQFRIPEGV